MLLWIGKILRLLINYVLLLFSLSFCISGFSTTLLEALPYHGDQSVLTEIKSAKHSLQITMYGFTDKKIAAALIQQYRQGVNVQLLIEHDPYKASEENVRIIKQLKHAGIVVHYTAAAFLLTHQKTILIDQQRAMILTGNFTYSGFYHQRNFIAITDDVNIVKALKQLFEADWNQRHYLFSKNTALILSPENSAQALSEFITNSHKTLEIYALELTDKRIINTLLNQKVKIKIITSRFTKIYNKNSLCRHHIEIHQLKNIDQHAKALLRDYRENNALAYVGSANLSYPSLSKNREVGIFFSDKKTLSKLNATFEKDWNNSISVCSITNT